MKGNDNMMNWIKKNGLAISNTCGIVFLVGLMVWYIGVMANLERKMAEPEPVVIYQTVEVPTVVSEESAASEMFDTSALETWCRGADQGTLRMVGAWQAEGYDKGVVEDEQGNLWNITEDYEEYDFLLLWIADNHTEDVTDDEIMKVWREAYIK